jgi:hypothetical protein
MANVRALTEKDIPDVAELRRRVFRWRQEEPAAARESAVRRVFWENPFVDCRTPSLVLEDSEEGIVGFIGVSARRFRLGCEEILGAVCSSFMAEGRGRGLGGAQLLKRFLEGPQDLSFVDSPNTEALNLWARLGTVHAARESLHWVRPLRPVRYAVGRLRGGRLPQVARVLARPFAMGLDALAVRATKNPFYLPAPESQEGPLAPEELRRCLADMENPGCLVPLYGQDSLEWLLDSLERGPKGSRLRKALVRGKTGEPIGWYIRIANPGGMSDVIQYGANGNHHAELLNHIFHAAWSEGSVAVSGRACGYSWDQLLQQGCVFSRNRPPVLIHSQRCDILTAFQEGRVHLSRLEGEWWLIHLCDA